MSNEPHVFNPLHDPPIEVSVAVRRASIWGLYGFLIFGVLIFGCSYAWASVHDLPIHFMSMFQRCALLAGICGLIVFVARVLFLSRSTLAKAFSIFAFLATFSSLAMLVVFFVSLLMDGKRWFEAIPPRLEARNQDLIQKFGTEEEAAKVREFMKRLQPEFDAFAKQMEPEVSKLVPPPSPNDKIQALYARLPDGPAKEAFAKRVSDIALSAKAAGMLPFRASEQVKKVDDEQYGEIDLQIRELISSESMQEVPLKIVGLFNAGFVSDAEFVAGLRGGKVCDAAVTLQDDIKVFDTDYVKDVSATHILYRFLTRGSSDNPIDAGVMPALIGSLYLGIITILASVPLGVGAAVYLEEYRSKGWLPNIIQTNINNLAGIPSIVYGIFGALVFVEWIFKPLHNMAEFSWIESRNVIGGGLTLALLTLPVVIVSAQEAIRAVPMSIRHGALALGATRWQVISHHVLPNALPGILTGTILAMSRAIGEAAPLVFFGANLYITSAPSFWSGFTVLPLQIFSWTSKSSLDSVWQLNAAMASLVLMITLLALNGLAIYLRQRGQSKLKW